MINIRFLLILANGDGLRTMEILMKDKVANYMKFPVAHSIRICSPWNVFQSTLSVLDHKVLIRSGRVAVKELDPLLKEVHLHTQRENSQPSAQGQPARETFLRVHTLSQKGRRMADLETRSIWCYQDRPPIPHF